MNYAKNFKKSIKKLAAYLLCICLIFSLSTVVFADEEAVITENMQSIIDVIESIPKDPNLLTMEHKDIILQVEKDYEALSDDEKIAFPLETYNIFSAAKYGIAPIILNDVASRIEALPEKITSEQAEEVKAIQAEFLLLDETAKSALSPKNTEKLQKALEKVENPDAVQDEETNEEQNGDKKGIKFNYETVIIIVLSVLVLINLVLFIIVVIRLVVKKKERVEDEDDEIEE